VNIAVDRPLYEVPLGLGSGFGAVPIFGVELTLRPPSRVLDDPIVRRMHLGARGNWRLPFAVLLGQRGWFDRFPTTIDARSTTVQLNR